MYICIYVCMYVCMYVLLTITYVQYLDINNNIEMIVVCSKSIDSCSYESGMKSINRNNSL